MYLRPHHGLCIQHYMGKGYDSRFVQNMNQVVRQLRAFPQQLIELTVEMDVLCGHCPHNKQGRCDTQEKVTAYDNNCLRFTGLLEGQQLTWETFRETVEKQILGRKKLNQVCVDCSWLPLCERLELSVSMK